MRQDALCGTKLQRGTKPFQALDPQAGAGVHGHARASHVQHARADRRRRAQLCKGRQAWASGLPKT